MERIRGEGLQAPMRLVGFMRRSAKRRAFGLLALVAMAGCFKEPAERYILPVGYLGWVEVEFDVPGAEAFPRDRDGFRVIAVPDSGRVRTKDAPIYGEGYLTEYYDGSLDRPLPPGRVSRGFSVTPKSEAPESTSERPLEFFFVGGDDDLRR